MIFFPYFYVKIPLVLSNNSNNDSNDYSSDEKAKGSRLRLFKLMLGRTVLSVLKDEKYT